MRQAAAFPLIILCREDFFYSNSIFMEERRFANRISFLCSVLCSPPFSKGREGSLLQYSLFFQEFADAFHPGVTACSWSCIFLEAMGTEG